MFAARLLPATVGPCIFDDSYSSHLCLGGEETALFYWGPGIICKLSATREEVVCVYTEVFSDFCKRIRDSKAITSSQASPPRRVVRRIERREKVMEFSGGNS